MIIRQDLESLKFYDILVFAIDFFGVQGICMDFFNQFLFLHLSIEALDIKILQVVGLDIKMLKFFMLKMHKAMLLPAIVVVRRISTTNVEISAN